MLNISFKKFDKKDFPKIIKKIIDGYIKEHKLSEVAHEEITAMTHSDKQVAFYFHKKEMDMTLKVVDFLKQNDFSFDNMIEKVHIAIGMIDDLCHEVVYHKHNNINYNIMTNIIISNIENMIIN